MSRSTKAMLATAVVLIAVAVGSAAVDLGQRSRTATASTISEAPADEASDLEERVKTNPRDASLWAALGVAYVDRARAASDPAAYPKSERALARSLALDPTGNWEALAGQAALAAGRHDFGNALAFAEQARTIKPTNILVRGVIVDALTELGRYAEAVDAAQAMVDLRPNLASFARVSYQRELHGDVPGAIEAMTDALRASSTGGDRSFAEYHLGVLELNRGDIAAAARHYRLALRHDPENTSAVAGLGRVAAAEGRLDEAIERFRTATAATPDPEALKELGELYLVTGRDDLATSAFAGAERSNAAQAAGGVDVNLEIALLSADTRVGLERGLAAAREEWNLRQSVHVADALAWQLFAHRAYDEALVYANRALQLGTPSASFHFHRAEIQRALGATDEARADYRQALAINPHFSVLHVPAAKRAISELRP